MIPCFLTISGEDETVVQSLSDQRAPTLRLLRWIQHPLVGEHSNPTFEEQSASLFNRYKFQAGPMMNLGQSTSVYHEVGCARWWVPSERVIQLPNVRHLEGEIHLSQSLHPSCDFRFFRVQVSSFRFLAAQLTSCH